MEAFASLAEMEFRDVARMAYEASSMSSSMLEMDDNNQCVDEAGCNSNLSPLILNDMGLKLPYFRCYYTCVDLQCDVFLHF
jgi:hypothetical protein